MKPRFLSALLLATVLASGCAAPPPGAPEPAVPAAGAPVHPAAQSVLRAAALDRALEDRILALDPDRISGDDVRSTLAPAPTPRIVLLHGGIYPVYLAMTSFGRFLTGMGYPEARIVDPRDGSWSISPYESSTLIAGLLAWQYEHDGVRPMVVGHSQGGIQTVKVLHELAGSFGSELHPFNPYTQTYEPTTSIVDPLTGHERPVVGVSIAYASVIGTGGWALVLPNHWIVLSRVREIPDTVEEFVGYRIGFDLFAWDVPGLEGVKTFYPNGKATVRNVPLPASYSHVFVPVTADLPSTPELRAWIDAFDPRAEAAEATAPGGDTGNLLWAANVWHDIKRHWALEAQRFVRARRALPPA
jgi:hypothetical protein